MKFTLKYGMPIVALAALVIGLSLYQSTNAGAAADPKIRSGRGNASGAPLPATVSVGRVAEVDDVETRRYTGQIVPLASVELSARVSGEIDSVGFAGGEWVDEGTLLFRVDPIRYEAAVKKAEAAVAEYTAKVAYAEKSYERSMGLYEQKAASKDILDNAKKDYDAANATLQAAEADLVMARDDLSNTRIVAPIAGKIGITNFTEGNYVTPASGKLAAIVKTDLLRVRFSISSRDYLAMFRNEDILKEKASVILRLSDDSLYERQGTVDLVDNRADGRSDTVTIYARFDNPEGVLIPDGTVTVLLSKINGGKLAAVSPSAVMFDATSPYVYVLDAQNTVQRREVKLGASASQVQTIQAGVLPGELVVIDGMHKTAPGSPVKPVMKDWTINDMDGQDQLAGKFIKPAYF